MFGKIHQIVLAIVVSHQFFRQSNGGGPCIGISNFTFACYACAGDKCKTGCERGNTCGKLISGSNITYFAPEEVYLEECKDVGAVRYCYCRKDYCNLAATIESWSLIVISGVGFALAVQANH